MNNELKFIDLCAGVGAGRLGLEANGLECVGYSEIDKDAEATYRMLYGNELAFGDLTKIEPQMLPNFDLLISGFPCQTFSIVGKRDGLQDEDKGQIIYLKLRMIQFSKLKKGIFNSRDIDFSPQSKSIDFVLNRQYF